MAAQSYHSTKSRIYSSARNSNPVTVVPTLPLHLNRFDSLPISVLCINHQIHHPLLLIK
ncbi:hypothetical protein YC2023_008154 [Brassica napus]